MIKGLRGVSPWSNRGLFKAFIDINVLRDYFHSKSTYSSAGVNSTISFSEGSNVCK